MICPKCKNKITCGCKACQKNFPDKKKSQLICPKSNEPEEDRLEYCPHCNNGMTMYEWFEEEGRQYSLFKERVGLSKT